MARSRSRKPNRDKLLEALASVYLTKHGDSYRVIGVNDGNPYIYDRARPVERDSMGTPKIDTWMRNGARSPSVKSKSAARPFNSLFYEAPEGQIKSREFKRLRDALKMIKDRFVPRNNDPDPFIPYSLK